MLHTPQMASVLPEGIPQEHLDLMQDAAVRERMLDIVQLVYPCLVLLHAHGGDVVHELHERVVRGRQPGQEAVGLDADIRPAVWHPRHVIVQEHWDAAELYGSAGR